MLQSHQLTQPTSSKVEEIRVGRTIPKDELLAASSHRARELRLKALM